MKGHINGKWDTVFRFIMLTIRRAKSGGIQDTMLILLDNEENFQAFVDYITRRCAEHKFKYAKSYIEDCLSGNVRSHGGQVKVKIMEEEEKWDELFEFIVTSLAIGVKREVAIFLPEKQLDKFSKYLSKRFSNKKWGMTVDFRFGKRLKSGKVISLFVLWKGEKEC